MIKINFTIGWDVGALGGFIAIRKEMTLPNELALTIRRERWGNNLLIEQIVNQSSRRQPNNTHWDESCEVLLRFLYMPLYNRWIQTIFDKNMS